MQFLYILLAILIFGVLIFIHELGHFIVARLCGVKILEFAIGMGPRLVSKKSKKSGTVYSLRAFPIGGFVSMLGENGMETVQGSADGEETEVVTEEETVENEDASAEEKAEDSAEELFSSDPHAYCNQSVWKRILISVAGPAMNVILGFILMFVMVCSAGHSALGTNQIAGFTVTYCGENYQGLQKGDTVYSFDAPDDKSRIRSFASFKEAVLADEDHIFNLYVLRYDEEKGTSELKLLENVVLDEKMVSDPAYFKMAGTEASGLMIEDKIVKVNSTSIHTYNELAYEVMNQGYKPMTFTVIRNGEKMNLDITVREMTEEGVVLGELDFIIYREAKFDFPTIVKHTWFRSCSTVKMVFDSLVGLFSGRFGMEAVSGPVGITKTVSDAAQMGWLNVLYLVTVISINLGVMNLLPFPALDGGHLLIYLIEVIRRKPMKQEIEGMINFAGLLILLALAIFVAIKDIISL